MFRPQLAPRESPASCPSFFKNLCWPLLGSPKLDGIRGCILGEALSRTLKPLPSYQVQQEFTEVQHVDGEFIIGEPTDPNVYNKTQSHVMSYNKPGDLSFWLFDYIHPNWLHKPYYERLEKLESLEITQQNTYLVQHEYLENYEQLIWYEEMQLEKGFEGIMLANPLAAYKQGRATYNQGIIYKVKRFKDEEGIVIGFNEQLINDNPVSKDELGYAHRQTLKEHMIPGNTVGSFIVLYGGMEIDVAPGNFSHHELKEIWENREIYLNRMLKFRFFAYGIKDKPRQPRALGWRDPIDL